MCEPGSRSETAAAIANVCAGIDVLLDVTQSFARSNARWGYGRTLRSSRDFGTENSLAVDDCRGRLPWTTLRAVTASASSRGDLRHDVRMPSRAQPSNAPVTLALLAEELGVHVSTVSRALSDDPVGVGSETVERIR